MPLAGEFVRASDVIPDDWTSYTPVWTGRVSNPALGNGSITGSWMQVGDLVWVKIVLSVGSTTTFGSGEWSFTLPVAPEIDSVIPGVLNDNNVVFRYAAAAWLITASATGDNMRIGASGVQAVDATHPFTWATGDKLILQGSYRPA